MLRCSARFERSDAEQRRRRDEQGRLHAQLEQHECAGVGLKLRILDVKDALHRAELALNQAERLRLQQRGDH